MARCHTIWGVKWKCDLCGNESKTWNPFWKTKRSYRIHLNYFHSDVKVDVIPTFIYKRLEGSGKIVRKKGKIKYEGKRGIESVKKRKAGKV